MTEVLIVSHEWSPVTIRASIFQFELDAATFTHFVYCLFHYCSCIASKFKRIKAERTQLPWLVNWRSLLESQTLKYIKDADFCNDDRHMVSYKPASILRKTSAMDLGISLVLISSRI